MTRLEGVARVRISMGSSFTNVHVRVPDATTAKAFADRLRSVVVERLAADGFVVADRPADREIVIVPAGRWLACYDPRSEDQDDTVEVWARDISEGLATEAFSVLVHDSDVLALSLFVGGKLRDRFDSNPAFSGKAPSKVTPAARADKWAGIVAPGHDAAELAAAFGSKHILAEAGLAPLARAIGADLALLATGYRYLTSDGDVPARAIRIHAKFAKRPAWEKRKSGLPRLTSLWARHAMEAPEVEPHRVILGQPLHASATATNVGGGARGLRIAISSSSDRVELARIEAVITKTGRFEMERHDAPLVRDGDRFVAELPDVVLQPGFGGAPDDLVGAPMDAMLDAHNAGQIHINILGTTRRAGRSTLAIEITPLANPKGAHVERVSVEVVEPLGVPLRATGELHPYELDRLASDSHTYLLVLLDAPVERVKSHAMALLAAVRDGWPRGTWQAYTSNKRDELADLKVKKVTAWSTLEGAIRKTKGHVTATSSPQQTGDEPDGSSGFEVNVEHELGAVAISLANGRIDRAAVEHALIAAVDAIAKKGALVQAVLARWEANGSVTTPYESVVGIHGDHLAQRGWATRWLRAVGRGHLWLGHSLRNRLPAPPANVVELGPAVRIAVTDVAATEAALAPLLPSADDAHAYERDHPEPDDD